jgi:hypothetical protein
MKKQVQLLFTEKDEDTLTANLLRVCPSIRFINGNIWPTPTPLTVPKISDCNSGFAILWDPNIIPILPFFARSDGRFAGPQTSCVVEIQRSMMRENLLLAGRIAQNIKYNNAEVENLLHQFVAKIWNVVKKMSMQSLIAVDPITLEVQRNSVPEYRAGDDAIAWAASAPKNLLATHIRNGFFKPK